MQETLRDMGLIAGSGRSPGGGHSNPLQYSCLENPMDRGSWRATVHGLAKSWTWLKRPSIQPLPNRPHSLSGSPCLLLALDIIPAPAPACRARDAGDHSGLGSLGPFSPGQWSKGSIPNPEPTLSSSVLMTRGYWGISVNQAWQTCRETQSWCSSHHY